MAKQSKCEYCGQDCEAEDAGDSYKGRLLCQRCSVTHTFDRDGNLIARRLLGKDDRR